MADGTRASHLRMHMHMHMQMHMHMHRLGDEVLARPHLRGR